MPVRPPVQNDGTVKWVPAVIYSVPFDIDMTRFPFDRQTCYFEFSSIAYDVTRLDFTAYNNGSGVDLSWQVNNRNTVWDVVDTTVTWLLSEAGHRTALYSLTIRRRSGFYVYVLVVPSLLLSALTPSLFWILPSTSDRISLGKSHDFIFGAK